MPNSITYGSYSFPEPLPLLAENDQMLSISGAYDHKLIEINLIGFLTGLDLSGIHLQKNEMISGFLTEYQDLNINLESNSGAYKYCTVNSIQFNESDLTTTLPYNVSLIAHSGESFSSFFGIKDPKNSWSFAESENKLVTATHTVSARGIKVDVNNPLDNAINFVSGHIENGFEHVALFNTPTSNPVLTSRVEDIDKKSDTYSVTETYLYSTSDDVISQISVPTIQASISYNKDNGLSVSLNGSLQGSIDAILTGGLLTTDDFTAQQATRLAFEHVRNCQSDFESDVYSFVSNGPSSFEYSLNEASNVLTFAFNFTDSDNLDYIANNVIHKYSASISSSKDSCLTQVSVEGNLYYNGILTIDTSEDFEDNPRFQAVDNAFELVNPYLIASQAMKDFIIVADEYKLNSAYLNDEPISFSIQKNPVDNTISYNYTYNNSVDYSEGQLKDLKLIISDKKPLQLPSVQETIGGFSNFIVIDRTLGEIKISSSSNDDESKMATLQAIVKQISNEIKSSEYFFENSQSIGEDSISHNLSKYY